jgi:NTE family protein
MAAASGRKSTRKASADKAVRTINLALQGGGAHGAFTWGVLDRLLEDERLAFEGISATSAGAMNAAVLAYGLTKGGRDGARDALASFWRRVSAAASFGPLQPSLFDRIAKDYTLSASPAFAFMGFMTRLWSPYQLNPLNINPLRDALEATVDFEALRSADCPVKLFLSATNVRTGKIKVFEKDEICASAALASACLPNLFQAVEIEGEAYWDGGYMGNPPLFPLIYNCDSADVLIVHLNPLQRDEVPFTADEIMNRINEVSFNSSLMREMRAVHFVTKLIRDGRIKDMPLKHMLIHSLANDELMTGLNAVSKYNADREFMDFLRDEGRKAADAWLERNFSRLGVESTVDIEQYFL